MSTIEKPSTYYRFTRPEMLPFVPKSARRILDVGCSQGRFGAALKSELPGAEVWGVEPDPVAHAAAALVLDRAIPSFFDDKINLPDASFDAIVFNDSLEHFPDHDAAIAIARRLLKPGGCIVASVPNVRFWPHLRKYLFNADWEYQTAGILDRTHLRFFTKRSILRTLAQAGFEVTKIQGINPYRKGIRLAILRTLLPRGMQDMLYLQFALTARRI